MRKKNLLSYEAKIVLAIIILLLLIFLPIPFLDTIIKIKDYFIINYEKYISPYPIWIQILGVITPIIIFIIIKVIQKNRCKYTQDVFYGIKWTWSWNKDKVVNLKCYCPTCNEELYYDDTVAYENSTVRKFEFICDNCNKAVGTIANENKNLRSSKIINNEIQRIIKKRVSQM